MIRRIGIVLVFSSLLAAADPIKIESGLVTGVDREGVHAYLGIPFAAPPIGELRWRPPQPVKPWAGILRADRFGPVCVQPTSAGTDFSEDCLLVNVWTPLAKSSALLPVMVWIPGGGFRTADGRMSGRGFVPQGVILVGIQYRVGYLGFYAHPALTASHPEEALANYGLMDQIAALQWVRHNIQGFGGDPARVTIFGESAGCNSVLFLMASHQARGLFAGAICESGTGANARPFAALQAAGARDSADLGLGEGASAVAALRQMPAKKLVQAIDAARRRRGDPASIYPAVDGKIVLGSNADVFEKGEQASVPLIIGANSYEGVIAKRNPDWPVPPLPADAAIRKLYEDEAHGDPGLAAARIFGDGWMLAPARVFARSMAKVQRQAWVYFFSYVPEKIRGVVPGVVHTGEIEFISNNVRAGHQIATIGSPIASDADQRMAARSSAFWVQFARTGNPNPPGQTEWPAYRANSGPVLELGEEIAIRRNFRKRQLDYSEELWRNGAFRTR